MLVGDMTYLAEAPPALCICSNNHARAIWPDTVCYPIDEAEISASSTSLAVVHTGEPVPYAWTASHIAKSLSALVAIGHIRTTTVHMVPCVDFSCTGQRGQHMLESIVRGEASQILKLAPSWTVMWVARVMMQSWTRAAKSLSPKEHMNENDVVIKNVYA